MKKILIINPFGIGDVIFSMYLVEALRHHDPHYTIGFLCNERTKELVRLNVSIDRTYVFNRDFFRRLWKKNPFLMLKELKALLGLIRTENFDTVFDLSLGREYSFFMMLAGIKRRIGFDFKGRGIFLTRKIKIDGYSQRPVAETQLSLLAIAGLNPQGDFLKIPIKASDNLAALVEKELRRRQFLDGSKIIAVAPGGGRSWGENAIFKQWDANRFAQILNRYAKNTRAKALVIGDQAEEDVLEKTARLLEVPYFLVKNEPIEKVSAFLQFSEVLLCNDGGLLHLANALGVKTIAIFGPVDEKVYGPYDKNIGHEVLTEAVPCRPCYQKFHFPPCPYERRCLTELSTNKVLAALEKIA